MDLKKTDDAATRERLESIKQNQRDTTSHLESLQIEYNGVYSKRNNLLQTINNERKETQSLLMNTFKQMQFSVVRIIIYGKQFDKIFVTGKYGISTSR